MMNNVVLTYSFILAFINYLCPTCTCAIIYNIQSCRKLLSSLFVKSKIYKLSYISKDFNCLLIYHFFRVCLFVLFKSRPKLF